MVSPSSSVSRPGPFGWSSASLDSGCGRRVVPRSGCRPRCGWRPFGRSGWKAAGLVVPAGVEGELADQFAGVAADDADVQVVDQEGDAGSAAMGADADVV